MTYFAQKLMAAVKPNTKLNKDVKVLTHATCTWISQVEFEKRVAEERGRSLNRHIWAEPITDGFGVVYTLANPDNQ